MSDLTSSPVSPYYTVKINSSRHGPVQGNMPKEFGYRLYSSWASLLGNLSPVALAGSLGPALEFGANMVGRSFLNQFNTIQTWTGNSPLEVMIPMQLRASYSAYEEVVVPIEKLSKMLLPGLDEGGFFLPPGPGPGKTVSSQSTTSPASETPTLTSSGTGVGSFAEAAQATITSAIDKVSGVWDKIKSQASEGHIVDSAFTALGIPGSLVNSGLSDLSDKYRDQITVKLGNFMELRDVILVGLDVTYAGDMSTDGYPMSATVTALFRTLYTISSEDLSRMMIRKGSIQMLPDGIAGHIDQVGASISTIIETSPNTFDVGVAAIDNEFFIPTPEG